MDDMDDMNDSPQPAGGAVSTYRGYDRQSLLPVFSPKTVAVLGASEEPGSFGRALLWNLISNPFGGTVFPINPCKPGVLGIKSYPNLAAAPDKVELAVIATPAHTVPGIIDECVEVGVPAAIIISSGFREVGEEGAQLEREVLTRAQAGNMRLLGPNCFGVMMPYTGLNATISRGMAAPGNVAFLSQSGAISAAILDWSFREKVGFSALISIGNMLDIQWSDLIYFLADDPRTHSIVIYLESVGEARSFLSASREVALNKPIIVLHGGEACPLPEVPATSISRLAAAKEARSHRIGNRVLNAAFRRCGILPVRSLVDLFAMAEILAKQPRARGPRLAIITNAHGSGAQAANALVSSGGELAPLAGETIAALNEILPPEWSRTNPVNILRDAGPERYRKTLEIVSKDPYSDGVLVILTPQAMTDPTGTAEKIKPFARLANPEGSSLPKPLLASWMGGDVVAEGKALLNTLNVPTFPFPDEAARVFSYMWQYSYNLRGLFETPELPVDSEEHSPDRERAARIIQSAQDAGRTLLTDLESKQLLDAYHIPILLTQWAQDENEALELAETLGYPVVVKLHSQTLPDPVAPRTTYLNVMNAAAVKKAFRAIKDFVNEKHGGEHFQGVTVQPMLPFAGYKLILGCCQDPCFGPVLLFGAGGSLVEIHQDVALALPPLNGNLARRMMEQTRIYQALKGEMGLIPVNLEELELLLVRFSQLVVEQRRIKEIEINPLLASAVHLTVSSARMVLQEPGKDEKDLPRLAIRPYPVQYVRSHTLRDGTPVTIRPIRPEDEPLIARFHHTLSDQSVYLRYFHPIALQQRIAHERLSRICFIDYDREMVLVVVKKDPTTAEPHIIAVGRLNRLRGVNEAEFAILISDAYQRSGLGTALLGHLVQIGRTEKIDRIVADILLENRGMLRACEKVGFTLRYDYEEQIAKAVIKL